jgi:enoyl-[acyl-carrier protein] reductase II
MSSIRTPLCDQLGIDYPIFSVGFVEGATPELVAAVSGAGGCGVLGGCPPDEIRRRIAHVRRLTDRPFGQNIIIANFDDPSETDEEGRKHDRERVEAAIA